MDSDFYDYPLLNYPSLMLTVLRRAAKEEASLCDCFEALRGSLRRAREPMAASPAEVKERVARARTYLVRAGLLACTGAGRFRATARGRNVLLEHPRGVDDSVLMQFAEFRDFVHSRGAVPHGAPCELVQDQGHQAFGRGKLLSDNPFDFDTAAHLAWEQGWFDALDEVHVRH